MAALDETELYTLSRNSFQYLPNEVKKLLVSKASKRVKEHPQISSNEK